MSPLLSLKQLDKIDDLETEIEDRLREKSILQRIDYYSNNRIDFIDLFKPYELLVKHIEELQKELRELKQNHSLHVFEEEEEEEDSSSLSSKYNIEHVIKGKDGNQRPLKPEDLDIEKHKGVRNAFKLIYEWYRDYKVSKEYEEEEEEEIGNPFDAENRKNFLEMVKKRMKEDKMGQDDITNFLRKHQPKWFTSSQISEALQTSRQSINRCLRIMKKRCEIKEKKIKVMLRGRLGFIPRQIPFYSFKKK